AKPAAEKAAAAAPVEAPKQAADAPPEPAKPAPPPEEKRAAAPPPSEPKAAPPEPVAAKIERKAVAPDPKAPVRAELHKSGDNMRIEFPFTTPAPAAVFRRADTVWLVFDTEAAIDLTALKRDAGDALRDAQVERDDGAAIVRLKLKRPRLLGVMNDGPAWIV